MQDEHLSQPIASKPASWELAEFLSGLELGQLPGQSMELLKLCMLDTLGCMIGALSTGVAGVMHDYLHGQESPGLCSVAGWGRGVNAESAALVNGTLAHALIFDDMHRHAKLHPGVVTLPAVLACAEAQETPGYLVLCALAAGYETAARAGVAVNMTEHRHLGWRATGTAGSFGAAAGAAKVLGLSSGQTHQALAVAAAQASGTFAFQADGGMELYLAAGTAARNGVVAAYLARAGFQGARDPLGAADGGYLLAASNNAADPGVMAVGLGSQFRLQDVCIKMHPTCHSTQTAIDAVLELRKEHALNLDDIDHIVVRAGEITVLQCGWDYEPAGPERLIFHMGLALAIAIESGEIRPVDYEGRRKHDSRLVRIAKSTQVQADKEFTRIYKERKPSLVTLHMKDGSALSRQVDFCRGEPENPPDYETVYRKFRGLCSRYLRDTEIEEIADLVMTLEDAPNMMPIGQYLRKAAARS